MQRDSVPFSEIKRRSRLASALARMVVSERNQRWIGWTGEVLIDEVGKTAGSWIGRNFAYKPVVVRNSDSDSLLGEKLHVKIVKTFTNYLEGEICD